jgi:hypothetical protein
VAVTRATLIARYPEFTDTPETLVNSCIEEAQEMVSSTIFRGKTDMAVKALAAHYIAINPLGELARIKGAKMTTYWTHYMSIQKAIPSSPVIG